jgi:hypothetical protein
MENVKIENITEEEFYTKYKRRKNFIDKNVGFDGCMFETFGEELDYVFKMSKKNCVVTILEGDEIFEREETYIDSNGIIIKEIVSDSALYYASGFHYINRLGYFILDKPYEFEFEVKAS